MIRPLYYANKNKTVYQIKKKSVCREQGNIQLNEIQKKKNRLLQSIYR